MSEIKPWRDRAPKETTSFDYPRVCRETADAEIAELRARVAQQAEMVEKCMVAMNENADRGMKAEQERDELRAALAKSQPVEQGEPAEVQGRPAENFSFMVVDPKDADELIKCGWEIRKLFTHPVRPMSDEEREDAFSRLPNAKSGQFYYYLGIADAEAFHGIKGVTE